MPICIVSSFLVWVASGVVARSPRLGFRVGLGELVDPDEV